MKSTKEKKIKDHGLGSTVRAYMRSVGDGQIQKQFDQLATEEPLEIRVVCWQGTRQKHHRICITMRTPGDDLELAAGFLFTENVISKKNEIQKIEHSTNATDLQPHNVVNVYLKKGVLFDAKKLSRNVYTTSSCGICGKTSLELVRLTCAQLPVGQFRLPKDYFVHLPPLLQRRQELFCATGGLHASALFNAEGNPLLVREDVGRHNAMDKLVGALLLEKKLPANNTVVLVSGRASFELVQKAALAGIPVFAAVGAPTSLAVEVAKEFGMTLVGFLRDHRYNIYTSSERVDLDS
jgi:FdhD protein